MADKYVDTTLVTGANDGTSIADAWQDFREVLLNTMVSGSYVAGDTINIRSHDGATDIVIDLGTTALVQAQIATESDPIVFLADDGTHWPEGGVLKIKHSNDTVAFRFTKFCKWIAKSLDGLIFEQAGVSHRRDLVIAGSNTFENVKWDATIPASDKVHTIVMTNDGALSVKDKPSHIIFRNNTFVSRQNRATASNSFPYLATYGYNIEVEYVNCNFDMTNHGDKEAFMQAVSSLSGGAGASSAGAGKIRIRGGKIISPSASKTFIQYYASALNSEFRNAQHFDIVGLNAGLSTVEFSSIGIGGLIHNSSSMEFITQGINGGQQTRTQNLTGIAEWDPTGNFPKLSATLPDSANTKWTVKVYPDRCHASHPYKMLSINKFYNGAPATKTVTTELAIRDTAGIGGSGAYDSPQNDEWYMYVTYVDDATGQYTTETTHGSGALPTSVAAWLPLSGGQVTFGSNNYNRHKLELTTLHSVKKDTMMYIEVFSTKPAIVADDFYFVDPDPSVV